MRYVQLPAVSATKSFFVTVIAPVLFVVCLLGTSANRARAQDLPIYTDSLRSGFQNYSWATVNFANTSPAQSGSDSIAVT